MSRDGRARELRDLMDRLGIGALLLQRPANFAWYTGGADNRVDHASPLGIAALLITPDEEYVVTNNVEAGRMREEVTPNLEVVEHPWYEKPLAVIREVSGGASMGADFQLEGAVDVAGKVSPLRYVLDEDALSRYRSVGADVARAIEETAHSLSPKTRESDAAASLAAACRRRNLFTPVLIAASYRRLSRYRHPVTRGEPLGSGAMMVVCAERGGLYANLTRFVDFEQPDAETMRRRIACENVLRRMREEATRPGHTLAQAFSDCQRFYSEEGFPDRWRGHHQGGLTGYASREVVATSASAHPIEVGQAFTWNPSLPGAKAEETFFLTVDRAEVVTRAQDS